jgi:hypothetical protein
MSDINNVQLDPQLMLAATTNPAFGTAKLNLEKAQADDASANAANANADAQLRNLQMRQMQQNQQAIARAYQMATTPPATPGQTLPGTTTGANGRPSIMQGQQQDPAPTLGGIGQPPAQNQAQPAPAPQPVFDASDAAVANRMRPLLQQTLTPDAYGKWEETTKNSLSNQEQALKLKDVQQASRDNDIYNAAADKFADDPAAMRREMITNHASPALIQKFDQSMTAHKIKLAKLSKEDLEATAAGHTAAGDRLQLFSTQNAPTQYAGWTQEKADLVRDKLITQAESDQLGEFVPPADQLHHIINGLKFGGAMAKDLAGAQKEDNEAPGQVAKSTQEQMTAAAQALGAAPDAATYTRAYDALPPAQQAKFPSPTTWTPATAASVRNLGMNPDQQSSNARMTVRDADLKANEDAQRKQEQQRIDLSRKEYQQKYGDALANISPNNKAIGDKLAAGEIKIPDITRLPGKEQIMAYAYLKNPGLTDFTFDTKNSFTNPDRKQAQNLGTISRIVGHIGRFESNSQQMGMAPGYAMGMNVTGRQNALNEDAHALSAELEKLLSGGVGAVEQTREWQKSLHSPSPAARQQAVDEISQLVGSQYEGMNQTYKAAGLGDLPISKYVTPAGQAWMKSKGINVGGAATVKMAAPDGSVSDVPAADVEHYKARGAKIVGQ